MVHVSLVDSDTYRGPRADLVLSPSVHPAGLDEVAENLRAALARLRRPGAGARALEQPLSRTLDLAPVDYEDLSSAPGPADEERRRRSLATMQDRFAAAAERVRRVHGLRLPRSMAVLAAFFDSLSDLERYAVGNELGLRPSGISTYFGPDGLAMHGRDGLDERLHHRYRCDPPEFVTVMSGNSDGLHFGLWYDDPGEFPSFVAHNYARDSAETWTNHSATPMDEVHTQLTDLEQEACDDHDTDTPRRRWLLSVARSAVEGFVEADRRDRVPHEVGPWTPTERPEILGSPGPVLPSGAGDARGGDDQVRQRGEAYRHRSPLVHEWITTAERELRDGRPAFALVLGRELHWLDVDEYRSDSLRLLVGAYRALGRDALAEIAVVHHRHRDLASVDVLTA